MAEELSITLSASYEDSVGVTADAEIADLVLTLATAKMSNLIQNIGTSEEAILLGEIATLGVMILVNLDPTNYIEIRIATGSTKFAKLFPKGSIAGLNWCVIQVGSGITAPFAIANSGACNMQVFICAL